MCVHLFKKSVSTQTLFCDTYCCKAMGKFTLSKAVAGKQQEKRPLEEVKQQQPTRSKILKASDVQEEDGPKPQKASTRKLSANAPVEVV